MDIEARGRKGGTALAQPVGEDELHGRAEALVKPAGELCTQALYGLCRVCCGGDRGSFGGGAATTERFAPIVSIFRAKNRVYDQEL